MSLVTSCPACATRFKIVPDQLKISDGWVRCGTCAEVFDASKRLEDPDAPHPPGKAHVPVLVETVDTQTSDTASSTTAQENSCSFSESVAAPAPSPDGPEAQTADSSRQPADAPPESQPPQSTAHAPEPQAPPLPEHAEPPSSLPPEPVLPVAQDAVDPPPAVSVEPAFTSEPLTGPVPEDLGFIKQAQRQATWRKPWVRAMLGILIVLLGVLLAAQYAWHERDLLAAHKPQLRTALQSFCSALGCEIRAVRNPEAISIESSRFQKNLSAESQAEVYLLEVQLKNRAEHPLAWPSLELSLTGIGEQVLVRHVIDSSQYAPTDSPDMAAAAEHAARVLVRLDPQAAGGRVSGYRVMAFYP